MSSTAPRVRRMDGAIDVIVIGAGHSGLAISHLLNEANVDHLVLERGDVANAWRSERWDSLKLLTPKWQTRLPGKAYAGNDPDGFMAVSDLVQFLDEYAAETRAPVMTATAVTSVRRTGDRYRVVTSRGTWHARAVVIATGACNVPSVPRLSGELSADIVQRTPFDYRSPECVPAGGVLVVGASATGLQLTQELIRAGRDVTIAVGEHVRMPRHYRGKDIFYWLSRSGIHDQRHDEVEDLARGRRLPSPQLIGSHAQDLLDLNGLSAQGARIVGRLMGVQGRRLQFSGSLANVCQLADLKMQRLLREIDKTADADCAPPAVAFAPTRVDACPTLALDTTCSDIKSVIWATGFRPDYSWLEDPVLDRKGYLRHDGGVVDSPGLYALGLPLMRRRKSSFIFGIEDDARDIAEHLLRFLKQFPRRTPHGIHRDRAPERSFRRSA